MFFLFSCYSYFGTGEYNIYLLAVFRYAAVVENMYLYRDCIEKNRNKNLKTKIKELLSHEVKVKEWLSKFSKKSGYQFVENWSGYQFVGYQFVGYQFVGCQFVGYQ